MKPRILLIIISIITIFFSCGKNDNGDTGPSDVSYSITGLVGAWTGEAKNSSNTISLDLNVDSVGKDSGSGVCSLWSIDNKGKVTDRGSFGFLSGGSYIVAGASWSLQLNADKTNLSGEFDVAYSSLHDMAVDISKQ